MKTTLNRLKYVPLYAVLFLWATYNWPLSVSYAFCFMRNKTIELLTSTFSMLCQMSFTHKDHGCIDFGMSGQTFSYFECASTLA